MVITTSYPIIILILNIYCPRVLSIRKSTKTIEDLGLEYEDEKNSMIAITEAEYQYNDEFYDEMDNRIKIESSMDMIFFGPPNSFLRLDAETILHIFSRTKKHLIPISRALLAWDIVTDGKTAAFLQGREYVAFGSLLNVVPEEDLYYVNFGDPSVFKFFSNFFIPLNSRKVGILVAAYKRYYGNQWYKNGSHINELGYLLCGFPSFDLKKISPSIFKEISTEVLSKIERCSVKQAEVLYEIATDPQAYGEPYKWSSHEIGRLNVLFTCISKYDISSIQLEAITALSPKVMKIIHQRKLRFFTKQQILRMSPKTRRIYILRMQLSTSLDTSRIIKKNANNKIPTISTLFSLIVIIFIPLY